MGSRVRWARKRAGYSQEALATAIGTTRQVVIRWEKNQHFPNRESREKLAAATGQPVGFFTGEDQADEDDEESDPLAVLVNAIKVFVRAEIRTAATEGGDPG